VPSSFEIASRALINNRFHAPNVRPGGQYDPDSHFDFAARTNYDWDGLLLHGGAPL